MKFWRKDQQPKNESNSPSRKDVKSIKIDGRHEILSVTFSLDARYVISGGKEGKVRRWRVEDGGGMETQLMNVGRTVFDIVASRDGKWIVCGTRDGVAIWSAKTREKVSEFFKGMVVCALDVSPGSTRIATGSEDGALNLWSIVTAPKAQILGPLQHDYPVVGVRFSPTGQLIATATQFGTNSVRIYSQKGHLLVDFSIRVNAPGNHSLAWSSDSKQLLALSVDGEIHCLELSSGATISKWSIHSSRNPNSIALAANGAFVAASGDSSVSFWDTSTHEKIGPVIRHTDVVGSMAISPKYDIVVAGGQTMTLQSLSDVLPSGYCNDISRNPETWHARVEQTDREEAVAGPFPTQNIQDEDPLADDPAQKMEDLERTIQELRNQLAESNQTIKSLVEKDDDSTSKIMRLEFSARKMEDLERTVQELRDQLAESNQTIKSLVEKDDDSTRKITRLRTALSDAHHKGNTLACVLHLYEQKHHCEALYAKGDIFEAAELLLKITNCLFEEVRTNKLIMDWLAEFTARCLCALESNGDETSNVENYDAALTAYSTALTLSPSAPSSILVKWAKMTIFHGTVKQALITATKFRQPRFVIYQTICDTLERDGRPLEAVECFQQMQNELEMDTTGHDERAQWALDFQRRCVSRLEKLGDAAMDSESYTEATEYLSSLLSLNPENRMGVLVKRSKARASMNAWADALMDADEAIELDPSCYLGYERRHAALHGATHHAEAADAFHQMLSKLDASPDKRVRALRGQYVDATPEIRRVIDKTIRHIPRVLIDTTTGHLCDKKQQAEAFEALPIYSELVSSMTTELDLGRILSEVKQFYRYVMLSHKWEIDEPLLQTVEQVTVYKLEPSSANTKLQTFCSHAHALGFRWAWSDTCCVDRLNNVVLHESLVAMFTWYRGSSLTIVYLGGVSSELQEPGGLRDSIWNTRAWTYQEYVAAEVVQFYTEDWKPYLGLEMSNHKQSPVVISEMQQATGGSVQNMSVLRPGLDRVREKLYLASTRQTTLVEDIAYSLLGIFNAAIPVIYGEGDRAVGRFLEHILAGSGDVTILAWTGRAGSYHSCLPPDLTVYTPLVPPHVPQPMEPVEMARTVAGLRASLPELSVAVTLYDRLQKLPSPYFTASRLSLAGIVFPITQLERDASGSGSDHTNTYHATTSALGTVEITTADDFGDTGLQNLVLIHPWIGPLLDQEFTSAAHAGDGPEGMDATGWAALRLVARLRQPFGALVLAPVGRARYRRVAADGMVVGRVRVGLGLEELVEGIRTVDIQ